MSYVSPTCGHQPWSKMSEGEQCAIGWGIDYGEPDCTEPATHISCTPYGGTPTCAAHKCRCAQALDANGETATDRRRKLKEAEAKALEAGVAWAAGTGSRLATESALQEVVELRRAEESK